MSDQQMGLYRKFNVERADGSSAPGGKHEHCEYFVLDMNHDKFAIPAIAAYVQACAGEFPALAKDLQEKHLTGTDHDQVRTMQVTLTRADANCLVMMLANIRDYHEDGDTQEVAGKILDTVVAAGARPFPPVTE